MHHQLCIRSRAPRAAARLLPLLALAALLAGCQDAELPVAPTPDAPQVSHSPGLKDIAGADTNLGEDVGPAPAGRSRELPRSSWELSGIGSFLRMGASRSVVRELRALIRAMVRSSDAPREELRFSLREIAGRAAAEAERQAIRLALRATRGNKSQAARLLRVDYKTLHVKIKQFGISAEHFRQS